MAGVGAPRAQGSGMGAQGADGWALVVAAQRGDRAAFGQLYERYVDAVFRVVVFRVGDRRLAEDITSETFLRALRGIGSVRNQGRDVVAWLFGIARNIVRDHHRSNRYRREKLAAEPERLVGEQVVDEQRVRYPWAVLCSGVGEGSPEDEVLQAATVAQVMRAVARLGRAQRECVLLRFIQELSVSETAAVMGRSEGAVKSLQHHAVRRLARLLEPQGALGARGGR